MVRWTIDCKKLGTLPAVSRSIILQRCQQLRDGQNPSFRGYRAAALAKREVGLLWSEQTKANFARGSTEKQEMAQRQERKRLDMLNSLTGPFTDAVEVEKYLAEPTLSEKVMQQRLKLEVQFARESTTLLPKIDPLFCIQLTLPNGKRSLVCYLGR